MQWLFDDSEEPASHKCVFCTEGFSSPHQLRDHWMAAHPVETGHQALSSQTLKEREDFVRSNLHENPQRFILPLAHEDSTMNKKFNLVQASYRLAFNALGLEAIRLSYGQELMAAVFTYLTAKLKEEVKADARSYIGFTITADCLSTPLQVSLLSELVLFHESYFQTPFCQAKDFDADQLLELIFALGTSDKHIEADANLFIKVTTLGLHPPPELRFGVLNARFECSFSRLEALARKREVFGVNSVLRSHDCALAALGLDQLKRKYGAKYHQSAVFRGTKLFNFEQLTSKTASARRRVRPHRELVAEVAKLLTVFEGRFNFYKPQEKTFWLHYRST